MNISIPVTLLAFLVSIASAAQDELRLEGTWRGESVCVSDSSACHDETVVYRIAKTARKSGYFSLTADKIVNGNPVTMGTLEFQYDPEKRLLMCEYAQGVWRFKVDGNKMEGTLTRPDHTVFRRVTVKKEE